MPAIIHCVRHAQGFHNLGSQFWGIPDPKLTPLGIEQCLKLKNEIWQNQSQINLVTASPLSRTLHTATVVFSHALRNGDKQILAIPDAQEISDFPADRGSDLDVLKEICATHDWSVDLSLVREGWNIKKSGRYAPDYDAIRTRARDARILIRSKVQELEANGFTDPQIVLVSHGGYLHYFTEDWEDASKGIGTGWVNCETRSYNFESDESDPNAHLVETKESRKRRGTDHPMLPKDQQSALFEKSMLDWKAQGLSPGMLTNLDITN